MMSGPDDDGTDAHAEALIKGLGGARWHSTPPHIWHASIFDDDSIFVSTYAVTRRQILETAVADGHDVIIEIGCGMGDVIGKIETEIPRYGLDVDEGLIQFCRQQHCAGKASAAAAAADDDDGAGTGTDDGGNLIFLVADLLDLKGWWEAQQAKEGRSFVKPLIVCVHNALAVVPEILRGKIVEQMILVAGTTGRCMVSYWNGNLFSYAVMNYFKKNEEICGAFDVKEDVAWESLRLLTSTGYLVEWYTPPEVQQLLRAYDVDINEISPTLIMGTNCIKIG